MNGSSWLDHVFDNYQTVADNASPKPQRAILNFIGATVTDNAGTNSTDVVVNPFTPPTGTGFAHLTAGVLDGAAKLVVNADVSGSAAIAVSKLAPGTNGDVLQTTGGVPVWGAPAAGGITQLTSDVLAGPGSGSQASTVAQLSGSGGYVAALVPIRLNAASGTFPAIGELRFKENGGSTLLAYNYSATDYGLLSVLSNSVILGAKSDLNNPVANVQLAMSTSVGFVKPGVGTYWYFTPADYTFQFYYQGADAVIKQQQQTGNAAARAFTLQAQDASSAATGANEHGGNLNLLGGAEDGAGARGDVKIGSLIGGRFSQTLTTIDVTINAANSINNFIHLSGAQTAARTVTLTRRPTDGAWLFVLWTCTGGFTTDVGFLTGAKVTIGGVGAQFWFIYGDGTDAIGVQLV